jgi:isopenicillin-N epimerase
MLRRDLLTRSGLALAAGAMGSSAGLLDAAAQDNPLEGADGLDWPAVRAQFALSDAFIDMSAMLLSSHPRPVRRAIEEHRRGMDADPLTYVFENNRRLQEDASAAAGQYFGVDASDIALTDSTTMGVALVYNGLRLAPDQEILSTEQDYYVTHESIRLAGQRTGGKVRRISLYHRIDDISEEQIVDRVMQAITPSTRVLALTWVHSSTGLKLPLRAITQAVGELNAGRDEGARVLVCVDGVHGFGIEDVVLADLGCDFFMAGCHKWLFGPPGTGIVARVAERTHQLGAQLKAGLRAIPQITVHTPQSEKLSAGIVSFDIEGIPPGAVVHRLRERRIIASVAPYAVPHVRLTPSIQNTPLEIDTVLREIRALVS